MNLRIKLKKEGLQNIKKIDPILQEVSHHFTIKSKKYLDGYFVFHYGKNSVCHFRLKEIPDWKFGIWLNNKGYSIFGEHEALIGKFKPSRTPISEESAKDFIKDVSEIIKNPKSAFVESLCCDFNSEWTDEQINKEWDEFWQDKETEENYNYNAKKIVFDFLKSLPEKYDGILAVGVDDGNKKGWIRYPRYIVTLVVTDKSVLDDLEHLDKRVDEDDLKNSDYKFSIDYFSTTLKGINGCDYKFYK